MKELGGHEAYTWEWKKYMQNNDQKTPREDVILGYLAVDRRISLQQVTHTHNFLENDDLIRAYVRPDFKERK